MDIRHGKCQQTSTCNGVSLHGTQSFTLNRVYIEQGFRLRATGMSRTTHCSFNIREGPVCHIQNRWGLQKHGMLATVLHFSVMAVCKRWCPASVQAAPM